MRVVARQVVQGQQSCADAVVEVVIEVGDAVGDAHNRRFEVDGLLGFVGGEVGTPFGVPDDALAYLVRQVQPAPVFFDAVHHAQALLVVAEARGGDIFAQDCVQRLFACVSEGGVSEVVREGDRFSEVFVEAQGAADRAGDLRYLQRVGQARAVVVFVGV
jgi:hypothetical protein